MSSISSSPDDPVIWILLMGRNGSGKSSSGNTILGERKFKVQKHKKKHEAEVCEEAAQIGGKQIHVIKTPDLLDPDLSKEKFESLKEQLLSRCSAGLSAVLLTVPLEKPVENEEEILYTIQCLFGPEVQKYIMILFTHKDELEDLDDTIDEHLKKQNNADLQQLVTECGGKFHCFNNRSKSNDQKQDLLQKIERRMEKNGGKFTMQQLRRRESKEQLDIKFSGESPAEDLVEILVIPERKDLRLVLLGKTGSGKSATGNTIIGRNLFKSLGGLSSHKKECQSETTVRFGKEITVIDTPGLYDTELSEKEVQSEIVKGIILASPAPHAFIIIIRVDCRFTEEEKETIKKFKELFGEQILKYTMIIFTHKDQLDEKTTEEFLQNADPDLKRLVESCGNRFFCLDNKSASFPQFKVLIRKIEKMVSEKAGKHFTNDMFEGTEKCIQMIQKHKLNEKVKQYKQENEIVSPAEWQKVYWCLVLESRQESEQIYFNVLTRIAHDSFQHLCDFCMVLIAQILNKEFVTPEEKESAIREVESLGIDHIQAVRLANIATGRLTIEKMCVTQ